MERVIAGLNNDNATDPNYLAADNLARIPDMISLTMGDNVVLYDDSNGLIEDPHQFFDFGARPEVWTEEEKDIFLHQYALYPKQFGAIAKALENKSPADCVLFYYLHKKGHIDFRDAVTRFAPGRRRRGARKSGKQKGNALISDIASSRPRRVAQKDSPAPSPFPDGEEPRPRRRGRPSNAELAAAALAAKKQRQARRAANGEASPADSEVERPEGRRRTTLTARARASMEVDGVEVTATKRPYRKVARKQVATPPVSVVATAVPVNTTVAFATTGKTVAAPGPIANAVSHTFVGTPGVPAMARVSTPQEAEKSTSRAPKSVGSSSWTDQEQEQFLSLLRQHGPNFKRISASMPNKTWFRANDARLGLSAIAAAAEEHPPSPEFAKQSVSMHCRSILTLLTTIPFLDYANKRS
ncbi:hypothetical protein SISNIDRAFT_319528 [Sistotremastrum niveocremeum HHB9708]|uniref:SANT domain-containing protein n=1 Tax=Sistotremastrum niveocremeum HHB9708 TaxID=1314777 RepID=A0A164N1Q2_9AGAM|nr:hypothetical protein SISNIDRAFT_319528 [Sistotremastrum niveocremeum HHB9708]